MAVISVTPDTFEDTVIRSDSPVLVEFRADWCAHCRNLDAVLRKLDDAAPIAAVDVDKYPELARRYGVSGIPTLLVFGNGKVTGRRVGEVSRDELRALLS